MIVLSVLLAQSAAFPDIENHQVGDPVIQKMRTICGPNSLYSLLRFWEIPATFADVERELPMGPRGVSLLSLKQAALHFGLQTQIRKYTNESLPDIRTPAITHHYFDMKTDDSDAHYTVMISFNGKNVEFIDGTTGLLNNVTAAKFYSTWSGYVLEPVNYSTTFARPMIAIGTAIGLLCICIPKFVQVAARRIRRILTLTSVTLGLLSVLTTFPMAHAGENVGATGQDGFWRTNAGDSVNCVNVYLSALSHPVSRARIEAELGGSRERSSLLDLRRASRALGHPLRIAKPSISDFTTLPMPAIVHMVDEGGQHGGYFLLISPKKNKFETINCSSLTIESMSAEEFRHRWSGYALVAEDKQPPWLWGGLLGLGAFGCGSLMYRRFASRSKRSLVTRQAPA